jgi:putative glutamine amidotransferase
MGMIRPRPVIGVLCCNEFAERAVQVVASRFIYPLSRLSQATVLLVPALSNAADAIGISGVLDGLLLTGSRSHVAPERYGAVAAATPHPIDPERDEVALALADTMIEAGKPVFGICRGLQEINVLFGGTLSAENCGGRHQRGGDPTLAYTDLFDHQHDVELTTGGRLAQATGSRRLTVTSVHEQAIDRIGAGLTVEAISIGDGIVEAIAARPHGADVLAVQWHPEWDVATNPASRAFFALIGCALRGDGSRISIDDPAAAIASDGRWCDAVPAGAERITRMVDARKGTASLCR